MSAPRIGIGFRKLIFCAEVITKDGATKVELPLVEFVVTHNADKQTLTIAAEPSIKCNTVSGVQSMVSFAIRQE
jgi:hypothetical protein